MERKDVLTVLESLANGIDPVTGARIPQEAFHSAETVRALFTALLLLKEDDPKPRKRRRVVTTSLTSIGEFWTREEDARLVAEHDQGKTIAQIALQHGRSSGAITSRLVKLGKIDPATLKSRDRKTRLAS